MNEPDLMNNRYQLHLAMQQADEALPKLFAEYGALSGREYGKVEGYQCEEAQELLVLLGSSYERARDCPACHIHHHRITGARLDWKLL